MPNRIIRSPCHRRIPPKKKISRRNPSHPTEQTFSSSFSSAFSSTAGALPAAAGAAAEPPPPPPEGTYTIIRNDSLNQVKMSYRGQLV